MAQTVDVKFFDKSITVKTYSCSLDGGRPTKIKPYVNLYVNTTDVCQAECGFCEFHKSTGRKFDIDKLKRVVDELKRRDIGINKMNFSGGEPTLQFDIIEQILEFTNPSIYTTLNTNGYNLNELNSSPILDKISCVSLSRHHYDDEKNNEVFGCKTPTLQDIANFSDKNKLHLRCNLIKGYIDSRDEVVKYINVTSQLGVFDYGFVSLMKVNPFCEDNFVDYDSLKIEEIGNKLRTCFIQERKDVCSCKNFIYCTEKGHLIKMYSRANDDFSFDASNVSFDIDCLRQGFGGPILY